MSTVPSEQNRGEGTSVQPCSRSELSVKPKSRVEALVRCPLCRRELAWNSSLLSCANCKATYTIRQGNIPIFDLYVDETPGERGRDPEQVWQAEKFDQQFEELGYYENETQFERQLGIPEEVGRFLFKRVKGRMLKWVQPAEGHCVLDVGCGAGYFLCLIREKYHEKRCTPLVTGAEVSTSQLSYLIRRMQKEGIRDALAVRGNGEFLPFADDSFDLVTCSEVLPYMRNPARALKEMHRILKPGGSLLLSTPSRAAIESWNRLLAPLIFLVKVISRYRPKPVAPGADSYAVPLYPKELEKAIRAAGLEILDFEHNGVIPHYYFKFLPRPLVRPAILGFEFADRCLKFLLKPLAMHVVVRASK